MFHLFLLTTSISSRVSFPTGAVLSRIADRPCRGAAFLHHSTTSKSLAMSSSSSRRRTAGSKAKRDDDDDYKNYNGEDDTASNNNEATSPLMSLSNEIFQGICRRADPKTKDWFTNYVKGTSWIGCKMPMVRQAVQEAIQKSTKTNTHVPPTFLLQAATELLQHDACDVKLSGMLLLSEHMPQPTLATLDTLKHLEDHVLLQNCVDDWSSADWFATKVLRKIVFSGDHTLAHRVLAYTKITNSAIDDDDTANRDYTYVRRCGVVSFWQYAKHRNQLPADFGTHLIDACEQSLLISPQERFTQTGIAWVLRYALLESNEKELALQMILRHGSLWTKEAKKSLVEKLSKKDPMRKQIINVD